MSLRILLVHNGFSSFVKSDYEILKLKAEVSLYQFHPTKRIFKLFWEWIKQKIFLLYQIWKVDVVIVWFADYHSILPILFANLLKKKSFLILGGYDVVNVKEVNYGSFNNPIRAFCASFSMRFCTLNLPVCNAIADDARKFVPALNYHILPTGYDQNVFMPDSNKEPLILFVALVDTAKRYYIKGLDIFYQIVEAMPDYQFLAVGIQKEFQPAKIPVNLQVIEFLPQSEIISYYQKAQVFLLLSRREGLPNTLCEAMLCECVPVCTAVGGIPDAVGNAGYLVDLNNMQHFSQTIQKAMTDKQKGKLARQRIKDNYTIQKREECLWQILNN